MKVDWRGILKDILDGQNNNLKMINLRIKSNEDEIEKLRSALDHIPPSKKRERSKIKYAIVVHKNKLNDLIEKKNSLLEKRATASGTSQGAKKKPQKNSAKVFSKKVRLKFR